MSAKIPHCASSGAKVEVDFLFKPFHDDIIVVDLFIHGGEKILTDLLVRKVISLKVTVFPTTFGSVTLCLGSEFGVPLLQGLIKKE